MIEKKIVGNAIDGKIGNVKGDIKPIAGNNRYRLGWMGNNDFVYNDSFSTKGTK
jgi:hypothetical protein